jgi:hypothetical protein
LRRLFALQPNYAQNPRYGLTVATPSDSVACKVKSWLLHLITQSCRKLTPLYTPGKRMPSVSPFPHTGQGAGRNGADRHVVGSPATTKQLSRTLGPTWVQMLTN